MNPSKFIFVVLSILASAFWIGMIGGKTIRLYTVDATTDPEDIHLTYNLHNEKVNANITILRAIGQNIKCNVEVHLKVAGKFKTMGKVINYNMCDMLKELSKDSFLRFAFEDFHKINVTCPLRKKTYYLKDYTFHANSLPPLTPIGEYRFIVTFMKVAEKKRTVLCRLNIYGEVEK